MSPLWMFPALMAAILTGFPVALTMLVLAVVFGVSSFGLEGLLAQCIQKLEETATAQVLAAVPLFIFMGAMFERSGIADRLFDVIQMWIRRLPGGLAAGTVLMCVIFAATSGVVGATETVVGLARDTRRCCATATTRALSRARSAPAARSAPSFHLRCLPWSSDRRPTPMSVAFCSAW